MKTRTLAETAILCATGVAALAIVVVPWNGVQIDSKGLVWLAVAALLGLGIVTWAWAFGARRNAKAELTSGEEYRRLADEYRRLADLAITAQEHTDLKLGDVSVRIEYLGEQMESLQKILKEVESQAPPARVSRPRSPRRYPFRHGRQRAARNR